MVHSESNYQDLLSSNSLKMTKKNEDTHPNGKPVKSGQLLQGILVESLIKQEHRIGWARKSACGDEILPSHPNETVAAHQWGVANLVMTISREPKFQEENPNFDRLRAIEMALIHDVAELQTGDITPVDGITPEEKHLMEKEAMDNILGCFSKPVGDSLHAVYSAYEDKLCAESKFVKDCDKLDFMIYAFLLERQGYGGFSEFYFNSKQSGFSTKIASDLAETLTNIRNDLYKENKLYDKTIVGQI